MLFKATNGTITLSEYVPIVKSGIDGLNGVTYQLQLSNISLSYAPADQNYNLQMSCDVNLYKNGSSVGGNDADIRLQLNSNDKTDLQYSSDHWVATVNTTVQSKSSVVTIYAYNKNGAYLTSVTIPVSSSGKKGDKGDQGDSSTGQALKGSPLRIVGDFDNSKTYYDGKRAVDDADGVMYQDVVRYNNMYYACVNYDTWESEKGSTQNPEKSTAFEPFRISDNSFYDLLVANKANIREISSEEVVIFEGDGNSQGDIVAGMTSGKDVDSNSELNKKVNNKGNVRIWAGKMTSKGDLTSAPFTVTDAGVLKCKSDKGNSIELKDGTIWFVIDGQTYHLGITNGKPDWIGGIDSIHTYTFTNIDNEQVGEGQVNVLYCSNGKYYTNSQLEHLANGSYYIYKGISDVRKLSESNCFIGSNSANVYQKVTFTDGDINYDGLCAIGPKVKYNAENTIITVMQGNYWHDIENSQEFSNYFIRNKDGNAVQLINSNISYNNDNNELYLIKPSTVGTATGTNYSTSHVYINNDDLSQSKATITTHYAQR